MKKKASTDAATKANVAGAATAPRAGASSGAERAARMRGRASQFLSTGRYRQANRLYQEIQKREPDNYQDHLGRGLSLSAIGQWQQALDAYQKAYALQPGDAEVCTNLILTQLRLNRLRAAVTVLKNPESALPYDIAAEIARRVALSQAAVRDPAIKSMADSFRHLLRRLNRPVDAKLLATFIFVNFLIPGVPWKEKALDRGSDEELDRWIAWTGMDTLREVTDKGQGVILLHGHMVGQHIAGLYLARKGYKIVSLQVGTRQTDFGVTGSKSIKVVEVPDKSDFLLKQVYMAQKALKNGAILQIAGDGCRGQSGVAAPFLGATRYFRTGFAELALNTSAPVLPLFTSIDLSGHVTVQIMPPLDAGADTMPRADRIESLIRQFAARLEAWWKAHPASITHYTVKQFVRSLASRKQKPE